MNAACRGADDGFSEHRFTAQDGVRLYCRSYGRDGVRPFAVLCLPGLARNSKDYHDLALRLAARYRVLCPDWRGVGRSDYARHWRDYSPRANLDDLRHLLAALGVHRVAVVGTSYGGILAAGLAVAVPVAVRAVVLNDIGPEVAPGHVGKVLDHIGRDRRPADWAAAVAYLKQTFPHLPARSEERWRQIAEHTFREEAGGLRVDWDVALARPLPSIWRETGDLWPLFRALRRLPVMAVRGALSDILSAETFRKMAETIPGLAALTVEGVGHAPDLAEPPCGARVEAFLDGL